MLDAQLDWFYRDTAHILLSLYRAFPRQISIYIEDISGLDTPDEYGLHSKRHMACFHSIMWLQEEGFIRYQDVENQDAYNHCVLTLAALSRLARPIKKGEQTLADALYEAVLDKSTPLIETHIKQFLSI